MASSTALSCLRSSSRRDPADFLTAFSDLTAVASGFLAVDALAAGPAAGAFGLSFSVKQNTNQAKLARRRSLEQLFVQIINLTNHEFRLEEYYEHCLRLTYHMN